MFALRKTAVTQLRARAFPHRYIQSSSASASLIATDFDVLDTQPASNKPRSDEIMVQDFAETLTDVIHISPNATLGDAVQKITSEQVSALIVCKKGGKSVSGIMTVRDVLGKIWKARRENPSLKDVLSMPITDIVTPASRMIYCHPHDTLRVVRLVMRSNKVRHLPVIFFAKTEKDEKIPVLSGIVTAKAMADYASQLMDGTGGKKLFLDTLSKRRGLPENTCLNSEEFEATLDMLDYADEEEGEVIEMDGARGWVETGAGSTKRRKLLDMVVGAYVLPHPYKTETGVAQNRRDYGPNELCTDKSLSEDHFFTSRLSWPAPNRPNNHATFAGVADGVGSWRSFGIDPRNFSHKLMQYAKEHLDECSPLSMESMFNEPPSPSELLGAAWTKVISEKVVGSATACIVSLDQRLNQLTYANLGDSGVIILRHMSPQHRGSASISADSSADFALSIAFMSQQQLKSFNRPYQLGYDDPEHYPVDKGPPPFDHPLDANVTGYGVKPGDIVIVATDGLFDNVELDEICQIAAKWEEYWFRGANEGAPSPSGSVNEMEDLTQRLSLRARELSVNNDIDSPFALLAKDNGILWSGGMPDDCTIVALRVIKSLEEQEDTLDLQK